jgi:hypothetical protein
MMEWVLLGSVFLWHGLVVAFLWSKDDGPEELKKAPQAPEPTPAAGVAHL